MGDDRLIGGLGDDELIGGDGADEYIYTLGDGNDLVIEATELLDENRMIFSPGILQDDLVFESDDNDLLLTINDPSALVPPATLRFPEWYVFENRDDWVFEFSDGSIIAGGAFPTDFNDTLLGNDEDNILAGGGGEDRLVGKDGNDQLSGDSGDDEIEGGTGDDTLIGGIGNDTINGGVGDDIYRYSRGDGDDIYFDTDSADTNRLIFENGILLGEARFIRSGIDLLIELVDSSSLEIFGNITIRSYFGSVTGSVTSTWVFEFSDGIIDDQVTPPQVPTNIADVISDGDFGTEILGLAGADILNGRGGNDLINGGADNDTLNGGAGSDSFVFALGDGLDEISFSSSEKNLGDIDQVSLGSGLSPASTFLIENTIEQTLTIFFNGHSVAQRIEIQGWDSSQPDAQLPIQQIVFADTTLWDATEIRFRAVDAVSDKNGDGVPNEVALLLGIDVFDLDLDNDGLSNAAERELGTDLFQADTDRDGVPDAVDSAPRDPSITTFTGFDPSLPLVIEIILPVDTPVRDPQ